MPEPNALTVSNPPATRPPVTASFFPKGGLVPDSFESLWRLADVFAASSMVPKNMIGKPADVFVAIQMGLELNLSPMQALQNIAVINGRPSLWGDAVIALVRASGRMEEFDEYFEGTPYQDNYQAVCVLKRQGDKKPIKREFSVADAKLAKLWAKEGPWQQYPKRMLQMRARSWALRDGFGDVLRGVRTAEEMMDEPPAIEMRPVPSPVVSYEPDVPRVDMEAKWKTLFEALKQPHDATFDDQLRSFVTETAEANECHESDLIDQAVGNIQPFLAAFEGWRKANGYIKPELKKERKNAEKTPPASPVPVDEGGATVATGSNPVPTNTTTSNSDNAQDSATDDGCLSEAEQLEINVRELIDSIDNNFLSDLAKAGVKPELVVRLFIVQKQIVFGDIKATIDELSRMKIADIAVQMRGAFKRFNIV